jgi:hypothetical protein
MGFGRVVQRIRGLLMRYIDESPGTRREEEEVSRYLKVMFDV